MKKYKRWILILTALTVFVVVQVESLRATSLIHAGKFSKLLNTSSTTSTTASPSSSAAPSNDPLRELLDEVPEDDEGVIDVNGTKITLTGIPQIDYVWDPNLPRELNGFNLSNYPFLDSMPADEDIAFDCEDKQNGFYASIKFGCQLYHHCLYGVRSDFICANFTAFDQKTFICHFASEVDCKNSYKYWSRNDDLYKATTVKSTTTSSTLVPLIDRGFYNRTRYSFLNNGGQNSNNDNNSPSSPNNNNNNSEKSSSSNRDAPSSNNNNRNNNNNNDDNNNNSNNRNNDNDDYNGNRRPSRRPPYRRRPADYYYYDDDYEEEYYQRRRNRPRNRRPIYDDYDRRPSETKTPDSRAGIGKPDTRRPYFDDYDDYEYERRPVRNRNRSETRNNGGRYEDRRNGNSEIRRRPLYDDDRRRSGDRRQQQSNDDRIRGGYSEERRFSDDRFDDNRNYNSRRNSPIDENKRKPSDVIERKQNTDETVNDEKLAKAAKTTQFVRPPPRISRPVPLSEKNKFAYKASEAPNTNVRDETNGKHDDEYEYEDDIVVSSSTSTTVPSTAKAFSYPKLKSAASLSTTVKPTTTTTPAIDEITEVEYIYEDEYEDPPTQKPIIETSTSSIKPKYDRDTFFGNRVPSSTTIASTLTITSIPIITSTAASSPDSFRLNRYTSNNSKEQQTYVDPLANKPSGPSIIIPNGNSKKFANKQTVFDAVTQETPVKLNNFQTAYNNRNLESKQSIESIAENKEQPQQKMAVKVYKRPFLPSRGGEPYKARGLQPVGILAEQKQSEENVKYDGNRKQQDTHKLTLEDLYNEEYDVDLNDALNPMLKPLTSSRNVHGYSSQTSNADPQKSETQKISSKADHVVAKPSQLASQAAQPEYYDDELEYAYEDEV